MLAPAETSTLGTATEGSAEALGEQAAIAIAMPTPAIKVPGLNR
jgi:hypothetical protein